MESASASRRRGVVCSAGGELQGDQVHGGRMPHSQAGSAARRKSVGPTPSVGLAEFQVRQLVAEAAAELNIDRIEKGTSAPLIILDWRQTWHGARDSKPVSRKGPVPATLLSVAWVKIWPLWVTSSTRSGEERGARMLDKSAPAATVRSGKAAAARMQRRRT